MKTHYHVRALCGVTIDWLDTKSAALSLALTEHAQVLEVRGDIATIIHSPALIKPVELKG